MRALVHGFAALLLGVSLSGCGVFSGAEKVEPNPLVAFEAEHRVDTLWSVKIGEGLGETYNQLGPVVSGERIFATDINGHIFAIARASGEVLWQKRLELKLSGGVGASRDLVFVTAEEGMLLALDAETGDERWQATLSSEALAPVQANADLAVVQLVNGKVVAFELATGEQRWIYDNQVPVLTLRGTSAPIVTQDVTFVAFASGELVALDNEQGRVHWERRIAVAEGRSALARIIDIDGRMLIADRQLYAAGYQGRLVAVNPFRAHVVWTRDLSTYRGLAAGYGNVYVSDSQDALHAFDRRGGASVWTQAELANRGLSTPVAMETVVAVADGLGYVHFISQVDGRFVARHQVDSSGVRADMVAAQDVLYVLSNSGRLVALKLS